MEEKADDVEKECRKRRCCCGKNKTTIGGLIALGISFAIAAVFLPQLYKYMVKKKLVLVKGEYAYNLWTHPPADTLHMYYHIFNYTNFHEMLEGKGKVKPKVTQIGPFVYRELRHNQVLDYNEDEITYVLNYTFIFEPGLSCANCSINASVFVPNIPAITMFNEIYDKAGDTEQSLIDLMMTFAAPPLITKLKAHEAIWGYEDKTIDMINKLPGWLQGPVKAILKKYGIVIPKTSRVALQHNRTDKANTIGNLTILTGNRDINDVQKIIRWRGLDNAPYWLTKWGRMLNGSDGSHAPPFLTRDQKVWGFVPEICRSIYEVYEKDVKHRGLDLYRFHTTPELFANHSMNPDNIAFCSDNNTCWGSGLLPISKCQPGGMEGLGPPIFISSPHFYMSDPKMAERIDGMHPNESLHQTIVDIEPITGITLRAHKRLQINIMARRYWLKVSQTLQYKVNMLPMLMIEEREAIGPVLAADFHSRVIQPKIMLGYVQYALIGLSSLIVLMALAITSLMISDFYRSTIYKEEVRKNQSCEDPVKNLNRENSTADIITNEYACAS